MTSLFQVFILKSKGVPVLNSPGRRGDQQVEAIVKTPRNLSRKAKKLLDELQNELWDMNYELRILNK